MTTKTPAKTRAKVAPRKTEAEQRAKAVAEANAEETRNEPSVEEKRERRAEIIEELAKRDEERTEKQVEEAREAGLHEAKLDDVGAAAQQKAARDNDVDLHIELGELTGPPVTAPVVEEDNPGTIKVVSRRDGEEFDKGVDYKVVDSARFVGFNLHVIGDGFLSPGEVIIDVKRDGGQDHQRFSTWTDDGRIDTVLPGINGVGDWLIHAEQVVTQVGEGRDDHQQLIRATEEQALELY